MRAKLPIIKTASESGPNKFNVGFNQSEDIKRKLEKIMVKKGNLNWRIPRDEVVIESSQEAARIMQERPQGKQAIIGGAR